MSNKSNYVKKWRIVTKQRMVDSLGGRCCICGYNKCLSSLDFHHLEPNDKEMTLGAVRGSPVSWSKIVSELRKCICVCSNCHGEIHCGETQIPQDAVRFDEKYADYYIDKKNELFDNCPVCKNKKMKNLKTCSCACSSIARSKIDWSKVDLLEMKKTMSNVKIGKMLGVSDVAVRKRILKMNLYSRVAELENAKDC